MERRQMGMVWVMALVGTALTAATATAQDRPFAGKRLAVARGGHHNCAIDGSGQVHCWGFNLRGQLGDDSNTDRVKPVRALDVSQAIRVVAGTNHSCALRGDGRVKCWGGNGSGQVGDGSGLDRFRAVDVPGLAGVVDLAAGASHTCAVRVDGSLHCWGRNDHGQLGDQTLESRLGPVRIQGLERVLAVTAGVHHTCVLQAGGAARCWGQNDRGQLGDGGTTNRSSPPAAAALTSAVTISGGDAHTCATRGDGTVWCWGANDSNQLGDGSTADRPTPVQVSGANGAVALASGTHHTCAIGPGVGMSLGVRCWGDNTFGQLGDGTFADRATPPASIDGLAVAVGAGREHGCALMADGTAACWGANDHGQLGNGTAVGSAVRVMVAGEFPGSGARRIAAGDSHTCAIRANGTTTCWGSNSSGQLGDGTLVAHSTPQLLPLLPPDAVAVTANRLHTCALRQSGVVMCWGENVSGQLGRGGVSGPVPFPGPVFPQPMQVVSVTAGVRHSCALRASGDVQCWGTGAAIGSASLFSPVPVPVTGPGGFVAVDAGGRHSCAVRADGTAACWGEHDSGQLGSGAGPTQAPIPTPVPVIGLGDAIAIAAGGAHSCALRAGGSVACWGENASGQLGIASTVDRLTATPVLGLDDAVAVSAGLNHTCALRANGSAACWGANQSGQLGTGMTAGALFPVPVRMELPLIGTVILGGLVSISAGARHTCATDASGNVYCWGAGSLINGSPGLQRFAVLLPSPENGGP